jgi:large subunit ribosomal protein L24e
MKNIEDYRRLWKEVWLMKCSFCGEDIKKGSGLLFVKRDGSLLYFCSNKCRKNLEMGRKQEKLKWTKKEVVKKK